MLAAVATPLRHSEFLTSYWYVHVICLMHTQELPLLAVLQLAHLTRGLAMWHVAGSWCAYMCQCLTACDRDDAAFASVLSVLRRLLPSSNSP